MFSPIVFYKKTDHCVNEISTVTSPQNRIQTSVLYEADESYIYEKTHAK